MHSPAIRLALVLLGLNPMLAQAQLNLYHSDGYKSFRDAEDLYASDQYAAASAVLDRDEGLRPGILPFEDLEVQKEYYRASSSLELYQPDAEMRLLQVAEDHSDHPRQQMAYFQLGQLYFREKDYREALTWFSRVRPGDLDPRERSNYAFQLGYCYLKRKMQEDAKPLFAQVREKDSDYYYPANYYYGFLALADGEFDEALEAFQVAALSQAYERVVPYSISQVYFARGDYQQVIDYASPLIGDRKILYDVELHQLIGQSWYALGEHGKALPYLQYYVDKARSLTPQDYFQLGVAQYRAGLYRESVEQFSQLQSAPDTLAQQALYLSGDALLKLEDRSAARSAFQQASRLNANAELTRESRFLYGKLSHELGFQAQAIESFGAYLKDFPASDRSGEVQELLASALLMTKDYAQALQVLESIRGKNPALQGAYQKAAFYLAAERYQDQDLQEAERLFQRSRQFPIDKPLDLAALYWLGEVAYRRGQFAESLDRLGSFLQRAPAAAGALPGNASREAASYTMGYANLELKRYAAAATQFAKVLESWRIQSADAARKQIAADATLRLADCYLMLREYGKADREYQRIYEAGLPGADYALFQRGLIQGILGNMEEKTRLLAALSREFPKSGYRDDALYEQANAHLVLGQTAAAETTFAQLLQMDPNGPFSSRALLKRALIAYNAGQYEKALEYYRQVARDYQGSAEGREALAGIRDISVETGKPELYTSLSGVGQSERDSVTWNAAYQRFLNGDCASALPGFNRYLDEFPSGLFATPARFYRAECRYSDEAYVQALPDYEYVLAQKHSSYTETSAIKAARIAFHQLQDYQKAVPWYTRIYQSAENKSFQYEALKGLLRSHHALGELEWVIRYGNELAERPEASAEDVLEARFLTAKAYEGLDRVPEAYNLYGQVLRSSTNVLGAEARYHRARIEFERGEYDKAKSSCLDLIQSVGYEEWVIRAYLLVADVLREQGELVQAAAALSSILDNYQGDETLLAEARTKLAEIEAIQRSRARLDSTEDDLFIEPEP